MKELYEGFLDSIQQRVVDSIDFVTNPLWRWYFLFALLVIVAGLIIKFAGWIKGVTPIVGSIVILALAYVLGGRAMYNETKEQRDRYLAKIKELQAGQREKSGGGWLS